MSSTQPFAMTPAALLDDPSISFAAKAIYGSLGTFADADRSCFPALGTIAERMGCARITVKRAIDELIATGWITRQDRYRDSTGGQTSNRYVLHETPVADPVPSPAETIDEITADGVWISHCAGQDPSRAGDTPPSRAGDMPPRALENHHELDPLELDPVELENSSPSPSSRQAEPMKPAEDEERKQRRATQTVDVIRRALVDVDCSRAEAEALYSELLDRRSGIRQPGAFARSALNHPDGQGPRWSLRSPDAAPSPANDRC